MKRLTGQRLLRGFTAVLLSTGSPARSGQKESQNQAHSGSGLWEAPARAARRSNPVPADEDSIARWKELYLQECAACHGFTER